jgi:class 3 adenylate cyclase
MSRPAQRTSEVLASETVMRAAGEAMFAFERTADVELKGLAEPVPQFRVYGSDTPFSDLDPDPTGIGE